MTARLWLMMVVRRRLRRAVVAMAVVCVSLLVFYRVFPGLPSLPLAAMNAPAKLLTYINRPLDLSSERCRESRLQQVQSVCATGTGTGNTMNILLYGGMSYCVVPKAGCTFWIRLFRFLHNDTGGIAARTPFDIDRYTAHDPYHRTMKMYRLQDPEDKAAIFNTTRFMFARDPYSRLWSAYVDKFLLPSYWFTAGREIAGLRQGASERSLVCGHDVSFREFLEYVVNQSEKKGGGALDGHWRPIQFVCDPCQFQPSWIGKQETFLSDTTAILDHFNLQHLLYGYNIDAYRRDEINILTDYNFNMLRSVVPRHCATPTELAQRLWAVFQLNGHLPLLSNYSVLDSVGEGGMNADAFKRLVYREQENHWEELKHLSSVNRRKIMVDQYRELPASLLKRVVDLYRMDFEYFGYHKFPEDIYNAAVEQKAG